MILSLAACNAAYATADSASTEETLLPTAVPTLEETAPPTETVLATEIPTTEAAEATTEATEPVTLATEPQTEATEPVTKAPQPTTEATEPTTEATEATKATETEATEPATKYPLTYSDSTATITITKEWYENAWCYIAHLQFSDYTRFGTACGNGTYGGYETTSHAAKRIGAVFCVNGCYSAPYLNYPVVRSGVLCNGASRSLWVPAVYSSQNGLLLSAWETGGTPGIAGQNLQELVNSGTVTDTFCFGPPILANGEILSAATDSGRAQRTFIGTNGNPGDIYIVVSDGRYNDGDSSGLTYKQCAQLLIDKGCTFGIPLDGGGSSTMYFNGTVLNAAKGNERSVVDFVYFK